MESDRPFIVSFSGIDGAGKTTQITALTEHLRSLGLTTMLCTFWDDIVVFSRLREFLSLRAFKGEKGVGSPEKPVNRRDKNVSSSYVIVLRLFLYLLDALSLRVAVSRLSRSNADVTIFDRYIYDELANLPLNHAVVGFFIRAVLHLAPSPDVAYVLDADPQAACARKPEYPLEFVRKNRDAYLALSRIVGEMHVIAPLSELEMSAQVIEAIRRCGPLPTRDCNPTESADLTASR
jgi:thymidylate kinase